MEDRPGIQDIISFMSNKNEKSDKSHLFKYEKDLFDKPEKLLCMKYTVSSPTKKNNIPNTRVKFGQISLRTFGLDKTNTIKNNSINNSTREDCSHQKTHCLITKANKNHSQTIKKERCHSQNIRDRGHSQKYNEKRNNSHDKEKINHPFFKETRDHFQFDKENISKFSNTQKITKSNRTIKRRIIEDSVKNDKDFKSKFKNSMNFNNRNDEIRFEKKESRQSNKNLLYKISASHKDLSETISQQHYTNKNKTILVNPVQMENPRLGSNSVCNNAERKNNSQNSFIKDKKNSSSVINNTITVNEEAHRAKSTFSFYTKYKNSNPSFTEDNTPILKNILSPKISKSPLFTQRNIINSLNTNAVSQSRDKNIISSSNHLKMPKNFSFIETVKINNAVTYGRTTKRGSESNNIQNNFAIKTDRSNPDVLPNTHRIITHILNKFQSGTVKSIHQTPNLQNTTSTNVSNFARKLFPPSKII